MGKELLKSCKNGDFKTVSKLLKLKNQKNTNQQPKLKGVDVNFKDKEKRTPLIHACLGGHVECAEGLLSRSADVEAKDNIGNTALHYAAESKEAERLVKALLGQKAPLNIQNDNKETPLHIACRSNNSVALKLLIESRANISIINSENKTPLEVAVELGSLDCIKPLAVNLEFGNHGVLFFAVKRKVYEATKILLECGISPHYKDADYNTPLHAAVQIGDCEIIKLLLEYSASPLVSNLRNFSPLNLAQQSKKSNSNEVLEFLNNFQRYKVANDKQEPIDPARTLWPLMKNKINWTGASGFSSSPTSPTWALCDNNNHTFCQILFKPDRTNFLVFDLQHEYHISGARLVGNSSQDMVYEYLLEKGDSLEGPWSLVIENACKLLGPSDYTAHSGVPQDFTNFFTTGRFFRLSLLSNFGGHFCALSQVAFYGVDTRIVTYLKEFECFHLFSTLVESGYAHLSDVWVLGYKENECQSICNNSNEDVEKLKKVINKAKETENKLTFLTFTEKGAWPSGHIQNKRLPELIIESDPGTTDKVELFFDSPVKVNGELFGELQPDVLYGGPSLVKFKNIKILNAGEFYYGIRAVKNPDILCNNSLHFIKIGTQFLGTEDLIESTADSLALFDI